MREKSVFYFILPSGEFHQLSFSMDLLIFTELSKQLSDLLTLDFDLLFLQSLNDCLGK